MKNRYVDGFTVKYLVELYNKISEIIDKDISVIENILDKQGFNFTNSHIYVTMKDNNLAIEYYFPSGDYLLIRENDKRKNTAYSTVNALYYHNNILQEKVIKSVNIENNWSSYPIEHPNLTANINEVFDLINQFKLIPLYDSNFNIAYKGSINIDSEQIFFSVSNAEDKMICMEYPMSPLLPSIEVDDTLLEQSFSLNKKDYKKIIKYFPDMKIKFVKEEDKSNTNPNNVVDKFLIYDDDFFTSGKIIRKEFLDIENLRKRDLSRINFDGVNVRGMNFSYNSEINININKVIKDFTDTSFKGVNLNKQVFRNANLTNTDLRETGATVDIITCMINIESKVNKGTIFDESNKFVLGDKKLKLDDVRKMGIKVLKKGL